MVSTHFQDDCWIRRLTDKLELLDAFSSSNPETQQPSAPATKPSQHGSTGDKELSPTSTTDFTKQLQAQMAALMGNEDESPEIRKEIEAVLHELGATVDSSLRSEPPNAQGSQAVPPAAPDESFQEAILKTMQRMQTSGDKANAAAASGEDSDDILASMLKEFQSAGPSGANGEEEFSKMLMTMMENLTNKDILYDPMKELNDKFPSWLSQNKADMKSDDLSRYEKQQQLVAEIVGKFEESAYSDANANDRRYIVERMQEVSTFQPLRPDSELMAIARCKQQAVHLQISLVT